MSIFYLLDSMPVKYVYIYLKSLRESLLSIIRCVNSAIFVSTVLHLAIYKFLLSSSSVCLQSDLQVLWNRKKFLWCGFTISFFRTWHISLWETGIFMVINVNYSASGYCIAWRVLAMIPISLWVSNSFSSHVLNKRQALFLFLIAC